MELVKSTRTLQVIGDTESTSFGIGDEGMIIKYLTENTYSNPLKAMVQEIMSNGRDAHIETGLGDRPIVVKLPNGFYPTWEVRDFGPGLTPQRMKKVFTQYGSSTKRSDNSQSGGFGIGAKTPWAYTDTFTVTTISDEYELVPREVIHGINPYNGEELIIDLEGPQEMIRVKRMKRSYACVKGEDYKNKLIESTDMACEIDLNDPSLSDDDKLTGTIISVEIAERDFDEVLTHTMSVSQ